MDHIFYAINLKGTGQNNIRFYVILTVFRVIEVVKYSAFSTQLTDSGNEIKKCGSITPS